MNLTSCAAPVETGSSAGLESVADDSPVAKAGSAAASPFAEASAEAKRVAAAVLEVLAGTRGPGVRMPCRLAGSDALRLTISPALPRLRICRSSPTASGKANCSP